MHRNAPLLIAALLLVTGIGITEASAKSSSQLLPKTSLYYKVSTDSSKEEIKAICAEIIKRQNTSSIGMRDASQLYMHGMIMGVTCIKVDYYKALVLAHDSGDAFTLKAALTYTSGRAAGGIEKAIRALQKYKKEYE